MLSEKDIISCLSLDLNPERFKHVMGVTETCVKLASIHGADIGKCRIAGLLHDCAKCLPQKESIALVESSDITFLEDEKQTPQLVHAPAGAVLARLKYGVEDEEILTAIRYHTIGRVGCGLIERILYISDFAEPGRPTFEGMMEVRALMLTDINAAYCLVMQLKHDYCRKNGASVFSI